ncbi:hypothetical protein JTB14_012517 [Gonioctena quinquepunctata]|nr:hypothetical protein JTB14_012517 [Gonioctena quinquepunctata]
MIEGDTSQRPKLEKKSPFWTGDYQWKEAITEKIKAHILNDTWNLVERRNKTNIISSKMVLKNKFKAYGSRTKKSIEFKQRNDHIFMSQKEDTRDLLKEYNMHNANPANTPMQTGIELTADNPEKVNLPYPKS